MKGRPRLSYLAVHTPAYMYMLAETAVDVGIQPFGNDGTWSSE